MGTNGTCLDCGTPLGHAARGLCARCLAELGARVDYQDTESLESLCEGPGSLIGRYRLRERIGEGGFGDVYLADQLEPVRREVALKIVKPGMDSREVIGRFEAERQALALMDHPNIAKVLDAGVTDLRRPYFVMELVREGVPITDYCDQRRLSTTERLRLFTQVCHAVQHAHQMGIVHRDLKPGNILVTLVDGKPLPKIIDFGVAKALSGKLTDKTLVTAFPRLIGTPAYMSPEQADMRGREVDSRSDVYCLGVLLYELLSGRTPFDSKTLVEAGLDEIRRIIREEEPPRPSSKLSTLDAKEQTAVAWCRRSEPLKLVRRLSGDLDSIVMMALEKDRNRRYGTADGLAADLERHLNSIPVIARDRSIQYGFEKFVVRNRVVLGATAAVAIALVAGLSLGRHFSAQNWNRTAPTRAAPLGEILSDLGQRIDNPRTMMESVAVLPFDNLSGDAEQQWLSDGIAEELIKALSRVRGLRVPASASAVVAKGRSRGDLGEIGKLLNVRAVLEGTVLKRGEQLNISVRLVNIADGFPLWTTATNCTLDGVLELQEEIVRQVVQSFGEGLNAPPPVARAVGKGPSPGVYQLYLKGRYEVARYKPESSIGPLEEAIRREPNHARPYICLSSAYILLCHLGYAKPHDVMPKAKAAAFRAIELEPNNAEAHMALGSVLFHYEWKWAEAGQAFQRALRCDPDSPDALYVCGYFLWAMGRNEEALTCFNRALEVNPLSHVLNSTAILPLISLERYDEAMTRADKLVALDPNFWGYYRARAWVNMAIVMRSERIGPKEQALAKKAITDLEDGESHGGGPVLRTLRGGFLAWLGRTAEAEKILESLDSELFVTPYCYVMMYAGLGDRPRLREWWQKAIEYRDPVLPTWKPIADIYWSTQPDFPALMKEIGL